MENWWTIIAKSEAATWQLIGDIGKWEDISAVSFSTELTNLESKHKVINMKLHSGGGSITEGIQMYNRAKRSKSEVNIDVEGIAASMASALLMAGKKRRMAKHSRLMLHQGKGGIKGSANQILEYALQLKKWNNTLAGIYSEAIAWKHPEHDAQWVKDNWLAEGKDTWFTAEEALEAGLIHEVYDSATPIESLPTSASYEEMVAHYEDRIKGGNPPSNKDQSKMNKEQLLLMLAGVGITFGDEVTASMEDSVILGQLKAELKKLKKKADLADSLQAQLDAQGETEFDDKLKACIKKGVITAKQGTHYEKLAEKNGRDDVSALLDDMLADAGDVDDLEGALKRKPRKVGNDPARKDWDYAKWEKEDPKGLLAMADDDPDTFKELVANY
jgi:ATP-dependent Clp protease, protease subunit